MEDDKFVILNSKIGRSQNNRGRRNLKTILAPHAITTLLLDTYKLFQLRIREQEETKERSKEKPLWHLLQIIPLTLDPYVAASYCVRSQVQVV
jgi:hypothetical protein